MAEQHYKAIRDDFLTQPLDPVEGVRLAGTRCTSCGEAFLGRFAACQNCGSAGFSDIVLSREATLYSFTMVRNRPPGDFKGAVNPFRPYPVGLVELPEGLRILSVLDGTPEELTIGMAMTLSIYPLHRNEEGQDVLAYKFVPATGAAVP